jgi:hypothetical protein
MSKKKNKPVAREFRIIGVVPGLINFNNKNWDLSAINESEASELIKEGCPYVEWADDGTEDSPLVTE